MKKLLVFMLVFCGCAAVLSAKNTPKSEALAKKINAEAVKQQQQAGMRNIMRVRLESGSTAAAGWFPAAPCWTITPL